MECFDNNVCSLTTNLNFLTEKQAQFSVYYMTFFLCASRRSSGRRESHHEISWLGPRACSFTSFAVKRERGSRIKGRIRRYWIFYLALKENKRVNFTTGREVIFVLVVKVLWCENFKLTC